MIVCDVAMLLVSAALAMQGDIGVGAAVLATTALMSSFGPVIAVANLGSTLQQTLASGARVLDLLDERPQTEEVADGVDLDGFEGAAARRVDFSYGGARVLEQVDVRIEPGEVVRVAGRSGAGKSTLLKLFMRFWDAEKGVVEVSGRDVRRVNTASLREVEGFMTQETHLFEGTIRDNLVLARPDAADAELADAVRKASLVRPGGAPAAGPRHAGGASSATRSRAASASASAWPACFCTTPRSCCSTSPRATSTA
ncbi:MAG: ABC transporter ATP-binding protein [Gordonibacter pamelaeae]